MFESLVLDEGLLTIEHIFELRRRNMADGFKEPAVVEPVDPLQCGELHVFEGLPGATFVDQFRLVETVDGLGESVIERIPAGPH